MPDVPQHVNVRLDAETRSFLGEFMANNGMSLSQAIRVLLALSLKESGVTLETAYASAAFKEGVLRGTSAVKRAIGDAVKVALEGLDE